MPNRIRVTVPSDERSLATVDAVTASFCDGAGIEGDDAAGIVGLVAALVRFVLEHAYPNDPTGEVEVRLDVTGRAVRVAVHDWGLPIPAGDRDDGGLPPQLARLADGVDDLRLVNLGANGKRLSVTKTVAHADDAGPGAHDFDAPQRAQTDREAGLAEHIEIRDALPSDAEAIAQLLYENYHLTYAHPDFYRPRWLEQELAAGRLRSSVAVHAGEVIGHHTLMYEPGTAAAESGAAVVHPAFRGLGILNRFMDGNLTRATKLGLDAIYGRAVTIHPYSQRAERSHGYRDSALMLGSAPARMQMAAIAGSEAGRRTALLVAYRMLRSPVRTVRLPEVYRQQLRAAYANLGLTVRASRAKRSAGPACSCAFDADEGIGTLTLAGWGPGGHEEVRHAVRHLLSQKADVVHADLDLHVTVDVDAAVACLNDLGFFYSGLAPSGKDGHDFLRLQLLNSESVELERIVCDSPFGQALLRDVLEDRRRVDG